MFNTPPLDRGVTPPCSLSTGRGPGGSRSMPEPTPFSVGVDGPGWGGLDNEHSLGVRDLGQTCLFDARITFKLGLVAWIGYSVGDPRPPSPPPQFNSPSEQGGGRNARHAKLCVLSVLQTIQEFARLDARPNSGLASTSTSGALMTSRPLTCGCEAGWPVPICNCAWQ